jgi:hypothetical protein
MQLMQKLSINSRLSIRMLFQRKLGKFLDIQSDRQQLINSTVIYDRT